jgi:YD repeat-containing protein
MGGLVIIAHKDKGVVWTLFPSKKPYMERPLDEQSLGQFQQALQKNQKIEALGKDEILGYACDKQKISNKIEIGPRTVETEQTVWKCDGFDYPLRIEDADGGVTETKELSPGPQPADLFEIPEGFRKASNMMELMGGGMR